MDSREEALKLFDALVDDYNLYSGHTVTIRKALQAKEPEWKSIDDAPYNKEFICRDKNNPQITFEAIFIEEQESFEEGGRTYWILYNNTTDKDIDDCYQDYEWTDLIKESE